MTKIQEALTEARDVLGQVEKDEIFLGNSIKAGEELARALLAGQKILVAGNGGSAADAQHFAAELVATFKKEKRNGYPVLSLSTDTSFLTAWANDFGYEDVFARQVQAWGKPGDVLVGISTSGSSENVLRAVREAKRIGMKTICLLGGEGGKIKGECDIAIVVPTAVTARIQEVHTLVLHAWCEEIVPQLK